MDKKRFHIQKILIPFDFSDTAELALEHAAFMAKLLKAEITMLHVVESYSFATAISQAFSRTQSEFENKMEGTAKDRLQHIAQELHHKEGISVQIRTGVGKIYKTVIQVASETGADIIVMGTHGVSGFQELLVGSNTYRVVSGAPCPILSVQTHAKKIGFKDIVLPIDNSKESRQKVIHAIEMAKHYNSVIHVAGIITMSDVELQRRFEVKIHQVKEFIEKHEIPYTVKMFKGDNLATISMDYAYQINADLIIIMTEQENNSTGLMLGSFAQQIVNHSKVPVLSVRPMISSDISVGY
jgi:nucleotide-binding universal stress UspA family protein